MRYLRNLFISCTLVLGLLSSSASVDAAESILHGPPLVLDRPELVASQILDLYESSTEKYSISDGLALAFYIIRTFNIAGSYDLAGDDLKSLIATFEELVGEKLREEVHFILNRIALIKFRELNGLPTTQFFTVGDEPIHFPINEKRTDSSVKEIKDVVIKSGASVSFDRVNGPNDRASLRSFALEKITIRPLPAGWFDALNQINTDVEKNVESYILAKEEQRDGPHPLKLKFTGISLNVVTSTIFKDIELNFISGYTLPDLAVGGVRRDGAQALPSFLLELKGGVLKIRVSLDQ